MMTTKLQYLLAVIAILFTACPEAHRDGRATIGFRAVVGIIKIDRYE